MRHYTHLLYLALAAAIIPPAHAAPGGFHTETSVSVLPSMELFFGPSTYKILAAIAKTAGDNTHKNYTLPMADIKHTDGHSPFVKTVGDPIPKEDWKSTVWFVEGDWMPPIEKPDTNTICTVCRNRLSNPHTLLGLSKWERVDSDNGELCSKDKLRFGFNPQRFAKVRIQTRTHTYKRKSNPSDTTKVPRISVDCIAIANSFDDMRARGFWDEELRRRERFRKWVEESEAAAHHPEEKPKADPSLKDIQTPSESR